MSEGNVERILGDAISWDAVGEDLTLRTVLVGRLREGVKVRRDSPSHREPASRLP